MRRPSGRRPRSGEPTPEQRARRVLAVLVLACLTVITLDARPGAGPLDPLRPAVGGLMGPAEAATAAAFQGARAIGIEDLDGICSVVLRLTPDDFHKSMTTHMDHRIWQDVYHVRLAAGVWAYVKLTVVDEVLVVSFKEL